MPQSRQLAAIMFTDIVGYTALMGNDEEKAFELLAKNRQIQKPIIEEFNGKWIKELGDGVLAIFPTVTDAVSAAVKIQDGSNAIGEFQLRIGIHQGEVVIEENDVFGDAVNIASRVQAVAKPGMIYLSEVVHHNVANKNNIQTEFVRTETLKNVKEPVRIYRVKTDSIPRRRQSRPAKKMIIIAGLVVLLGAASIIGWNLLKRNSGTQSTPDRSIAVLPFVNMSNDPNQEYFSDGLSEELLNLLAKVPDLKVIGRTSSFAFKGKKIDLRSIGEQLGVSHLLDGTVRKDSSKIRVTAQLIRVNDGSQLWSETFDKDLKSIFEVQEEISTTVVQKLKLKFLDIPATNISGTGNIDAYNLMLKGNYFFDKMDKENVAKSVEFYQQALQIDSTNARAWASLANAVSRQAWQNYIDRASGRAEAKQAALNAIRLDSQLAEGYRELGDHYLYYEFDWNTAEKNYLKGLQLDPDNPDLLYSLGGGYYFAMGKWENAINLNKRAIELDPLKTISYMNLGNMLSHAGRYDEASYYLKKALQLDPGFQRAHLYLGRNFLMQGKPQAGLQEMEQENLEVFRMFGLALAYHALGKNKEANEALENFASRFQNEWCYLMAELHAFRGEKDKAFEWLEQAYQKNDGWLVFLKGDPLLKNLVKDPRYKAFAEKMNLIPD